MCGFVIHEKTTKENSLQKIDQMSYRGLPEYVGYKHWKGYDMAHTSLPMVDPNPEISIQPICDHPWESPSMFVGEIFNWRDFGEFENDAYMLHRIFKENIAEMGSLSVSHVHDFWHYFDGFWSFITFIEDEPIIFTDFLGIKPVYYRVDQFAAASEPNVLLSYGEVTPNFLHLSNVMKWGYDPMGGTPWNEIRQLKPGHFLYKGQEVCYWDWNKVPLMNLRDDLSHAVNLRLGGFRDASILLSGGLDSSIIYGLIKQQGLNITPIHVNNHEYSYASLVAGDDKMVEVNLDNVGDYEAVEIHQSPVDLGSVKPQIAMARELDKLDFRNVLTGDGADELFGGYRRAKDYDSQLSDVFLELPYYHLPKLDRTMMEQTVELRAPFLAPSVICHALNTPYAERNGEKKVLKKLFGDLVPEEVLNRDKHPLKTDQIRKDPMKQRQVNMAIWRDMYGF